MLLTVSMAILSIVFTRLPGFSRLKFYPSYAALPFPPVIMAIAAMQATAYMKDLGIPQPLRYVMVVDAVLATILAFFSFFTI